MVTPDKGELVFTEGTCFNEPFGDRREAAVCRVRTTRAPRGAPRPGRSVLANPIKATFVARQGETWPFQWLGHESWGVRELFGAKGRERNEQRDS